MKKYVHSKPAAMAAGIFFWLIFLVIMGFIFYDSLSKRLWQLFPAAMIVILLVSLCHELKREQRDELTQVYGRRAAERIVGERPGRRFAYLLFMDIDRFKQINDEYGHQQGDQVLRQIGETLRRLGGSKHVAGRFGGDEFFLWLRGPQTEDAACQMANRILQEVQEQYKVSMTIGIALVEPEDSYIAVMKRADKALYQAKENGRRRCCLGNRFF